MAQVITIPYAPRRPFVWFHASGKRWNVLIAHRRSGKTVATVNHLIRDALTKPKKTYAYIGPTYTQTKRVAWQYLKDYSTPVPGMKLNESELKAIFPNGSMIYLLGAENPHSLRGLGLDGVVFDEYSQQPSNIFGEIISPALADRSGYAIWIGTIIGKNHLWQLHDKRKDDPDWYCMYLRASESGILSDEELKAQRQNMTEEEYLQEFELEPGAAIRGSIYGKEMLLMRQEGRIASVKADAFLPINTVWDLGMDDATAIVFWQRLGPEVRIVDYVESHGEGLDAYANILRQKGYNYGTHWLPHDVQVRELGTGRSRLEVLKSLLPGEDIRIVPNLGKTALGGLQDGIGALRMMLGTVWMDAERTKPLVAALEQYHREWDPISGTFLMRPEHDWSSHGADAMRYLAIAIGKDQGFTYVGASGKLESTGYEDSSRDDELIRW